MTSPTAADPPQAVIADPRRRRVVLTGVCAALVAVQASVAGLTVALPEIAVALDASPGEALWIVNAYTLALAALLLPLGAIGDRIGRRPVLLAGIVVFVLACAGASQVDSPSMLIALRVVAGVGGAMILPATLSIITASFPEEHRATAIGVWAGCAGAGGMTGLLLASFIVDELSWPWVFAMISAPAVIGFVLVVVFVPDSQEGRDRPLDWRGALLSAIAIGGIVLAIQEGPERGWSDALTVAGIVAGAVGVAGWVAASLRVPAPLLDLRLFRLPRLAGGSLGLLVLFAANFGMSLVLIQYIITALEYSAVKAAVSIFPVGVVMVVIAPFSPKLAQRIGATVTVVLGLALGALGLGLTALQGDSLSYGALVPGLLVFGVGVGLSMTPATTGITESLPLHQQGVASALNDTVREVGGALGIAVMGTVLNVGYRSSVAGLADGLDPELAPSVRDGIATTYAAAERLPAEAAAPIVEGAREAFVDGWTQAMGLGAAALAAAAFLTLALLRRPEPDG